MAKDTFIEAKSRSWKLFLIAVGFAILAGLGTILYLKAMEHRLIEELTPKKEATIAVVVAAVDLKVGATVNNKNMAVRHVPREYVNSDVITPEKFDAVAGGTIVKPLGHGKMLSEEYIDLNIPKDFSGTITQGHRAMTIQVDEVNSISGLIRPGNFIDLYLKMSATAVPGYNHLGNSMANGKDLVIPVLEDVLVLATDHASARPNEDEYKKYDPNDKQRTYNTLTLEVTPKEASLLTIAEGTGKIVATLRNPEETSGTLFGEVTTSDLLRNSKELLLETASKRYNRSLSGVHYNNAGQLVSRDGVPLKNQTLQLNQQGLLMSKDGKILTGRNLEVDTEGTIRTQNGDAVDTESLVAGKGGTLVDKNGIVLPSNGYESLKGGFLKDRDGNIITPDGHILSGVTVAEDGTVRTADGKILNAADILVAKDGTVHLKTKGSADGIHLDQDGMLRDKDGNPVKGADLVTVEPDGTVRLKDGKVLAGVYLDKDGTLHNKDGSPVTGADLLKEIVPQAELAGNQGPALDGISAKADPGFVAAVMGKERQLAGAAPTQLVRYEVEYIVGGSSKDGAANTYRVLVDESMQQRGELP